MDQKSFGTRIAKIRAKMKLSAFEFGGMVGLTSGQVTDIEKGRGNTTLLVLNRIASGLDMTVSELLADEEIVLPDQDIRLNRIIAIAKTLSDTTKEEAATILKSLWKVDKGHS